MIFCKVRKFRLILDTRGPDSAPVFTGGDTVTGRVLLELVAEARVGSIELKVKGQGRVTLSEDTAPNTTRIETSQTKKLIYREMLLRPDVLDFKVLQPGEYEFPFSFRMPMHLGSSFKGSYGSICYWMEAKLHRPWSFTKNSKINFKIIVTIDVNTPRLQKLQRNGRNITPMCCCSGELSVRTRIDREGYIPGDVIHIVADVDNRTSKVAWPEVSIVQIQTFHTSTFYGRKRKVVATMKCERVAPGTSGTWHWCGLRVPPLTPSIDHLLNIGLRYILRVRVKLQCIVWADFELPLVIGTVHLGPVMNRASSVSSEESATLDSKHVAGPEQSEECSENSENVSDESSEHSMSLLLPGNTHRPLEETD
ncbi:arrestin domain-containing protein 2-like [Pleurodeles waltl]|uniref:arrestin domain-containing protein 2-like n=1 Tax=Pleurodeles waltl TaxID=8319 RepID=UPI0037094981